jgi:hypothetical protein
MFPLPDLGARLKFEKMVKELSTHNMNTHSRYIEVRLTD